MKMSSILGLCFFSAVLIAALDAGASELADRATEMAKSLPRGAIVVAEQTGDGSPIVSLAGNSELPNVPPEKLIFEIGSISKVFTGILLAQAVGEKRVALDTTLRELMGDRQTWADERVAAITLRQLATHTSGLPRIPDDLFEGADFSDPYMHYDRERLDRYLSRVRLAHAPPFPVSYSNLGVGLLGDLLARQPNRSWEELVRERITGPLGMADTCVTLSEEQTQRATLPYAGEQAVKRWHFLALAGAGALHSTAADMLKLCQALRQPQATSLQGAIEMIEQPWEGESGGLCLQLLKTRGRYSLWFEGGTGGFRSWISVNPATARMVVVLINNAALSPESVLLGKRQPEASPPASTAPADSSLEEFAGSYDTGVKVGETSIHYVFEVRGSDLWLQVTGQEFVPLRRHPTAKDRFEFKPVNAELQFGRENGVVVTTTLFQAGLEIRARKLSSTGKKP